MLVVRHPEVAAELQAAALWYEDRQPGLGEDFLTEYEFVIAEILSDPRRWRTFYRSNRKLNFRRFPYALIYSVEPNSIRVKAVAHLHRRPFYWRDRI
jgi:hypothetical protein